MTELVFYLGLLAAFCVCFAVPKSYNVVTINLLRAHVAAAEFKIVR